MTLLLVVTLIVVLGSAFGEGDPGLVIQVQSVDFHNVDNPYIGEWEGSVVPGSPENKLSFKCPIKSTLPDDMMVSAEITLNGMDIPAFEDKLICDTMDEEMVVKPILAVGLPAATFPKACPISAGDFEVKEYSIVKDKLPGGLPDGLAKGKINVYQPGKDPIVTIDFEAELKHEIPGPGVPGMG